MTDRDRLIELIEFMTTHEGKTFSEALADTIIADGWIVPPCKVGDKIYRLTRKKDNTYTIVDNFEVGCFEINKDGFWIVDDMENYFALSDIGKTVFLTKEEAEAKLQEIKTKE